MSNKNFGIGLKGAILILVLLAAAIGISGMLYSQSQKQVQEVILQEPLWDTPVLSTQATEAVQEIPAAEEDTAFPTVPVMAAEPPAVQTIQAESDSFSVLKTAAPVEGNTLAEYAMESLSYNETTRDWRIHNGIDLAAEAGSPVCAAADGTVYTTYEDDTLGYTVVLRHEGGYTTRYSSLDSNLCVAPGDTVQLGQTIGYAGDTALVETVMGSHVHFSVSCQDVPMDPIDFFNLG